MVALWLTIAVAYPARATSILPRDASTVGGTAPGAVAITGPTTGFVATAYTFTATVSAPTLSPLLLTIGSVPGGVVYGPSSAPLASIGVTFPLTYVWQPQGQLPFTHTASLLTDTAHVTWSAAGTYLITVTVSNNLGVVSNTIVQTVDYQPGLATFSVLPTSSNQLAGSIFTLTLQAETGVALFDTVDAYLTFDAASLQVVDASDNPATSILANTSALPGVTVNTVDNISGTIDFSASRYSGKNSGSVAIADIRLRAVAGVTNAQVALIYSGPRKSDIMMEGSYLSAARHNAVVTFTYSLAPTAGPNGSIAPAVTQTVLNGASQVFSVTADVGYHITDVGVDGVSMGALSSYQFTNVTASHAISAAFAINMYVITPTAGANGVISPATPQSVSYGGSATFTVTPNTGYHVVDVGADGVSIGVQTNHTFSSVAADHTITATFAIDTFVITPTAGANGSITPSTEQTVDYGSNHVFTITPDANYHIVDVLDDGVSVGAVGLYTFTNVTADHTISATFTLNTFLITPTAGLNGSIAPSSTQVIEYGGSSVFTVTPDLGYHVTEVRVDGSPAQLTQGVYTFTSVSASYIITAAFAIDTFIITPTAGANGTITPTTAQTVNYGSTSVFTITANPSYHIVDVQADGASVGAVGRYTFTNVTADHTITASYTINTYLITPTAGLSGTITPSTTQVINSGSNAVFTVTPDTGHHIVNVRADGSTVVLPATGQYTFTNVTANHTLTASFAINTYLITPTVTGANGTMSPTPTQTLNYGDNITFTMSPSTGYHVRDVRVDGSSVGAVTEYAFTNVTANHTITASFAINTYQITPTIGANGAITPSTVVTINYGATQVFTITASPSYHVESVMVDGAPATLGAFGRYTFTNVTANHTITASFTINTYLITPTAGLSGTITPSTTQVINSGSNAVFTVTPNTGYHILNVRVDGSTVTLPATGQYTFTNVTANHTLTASFAINTYLITPTVTGANGTMSPTPTQTLNYGSNVTFTMTPSTGYHVRDVRVDGSSVGAVTEYAFTNVTANHTITASFAINTYQITPSIGANGAITPSTVVTINYGATQVFTITANPTYHVESVMVDGAPATLGAFGRYTFTNVTANHTITASFTINTFLITPTAGLSGTITPNTPQVVNYGSSQVFTVTPDTGYHIVNARADGSTVTLPATGQYTFTNVTANHILTASFAINTYLITPTVGAGGVLTPSTVQTQTYGSSRVYTITPNIGYHIVDVVVDGASQGAQTLYTFSNVTANHTISVSFAINTYQITPTIGANGFMTPTSVVTVNYGSSQVFTVTPAANYHILSVVVDNAPVVLGVTGRYTFTNVTTTHTISAAFTINTFLITPTAGANGSITPSGTQTLDYGTTQVFDITPTTGYHIASMRVDGSNVTVASQYTFTNIAANHTITAAFAIDTFIITPTASVSGTITPGTPQTVNYGAGKTFTITPSVGAHLLDVMVDGVSQGQITTYAFTNVTANHTITALFTVNTYVITPTAGANGSLTPATATTINYSSSLVFTMTPVTGYHVADVVVDGASVGAVSVYTFTKVTADHTITASFSINSYSLVPLGGSLNGNISPNLVQNVLYGGEVVFYFLPDPGYHVRDVGFNGVSMGALTVYTFTNVAADYTITASFSINNYVITPTAGANGSISPSTPQTVTHGASKMFTFTPSTGYHIADVAVNGVSVGATSPYTLVNVSDNSTITVAFAIDTFVITPTGDANGAVVPGTPQTVNYGADQAFTFAPATGYHLADVGADSVSLGVMEAYTFTYVTADHTITAAFAINYYLITPTAGANGSMTPNTAQSVAYSATQTFTVTPDIGYHIDEVFVDGVSVGSVDSIDFTEVNQDHTITATFTINQYTLNVGIIGDGIGAVSVDPVQPTYAHGTVVTLTATPLITSSLIEWSGAYSGVANPLTITMDSDKTITATFSKTCDPVEQVVIVRMPGGTIATNNLIRFEAVASGTLPMQSAWLLNGLSVGGSQSWIEQSFSNAGPYTVSVTVTNGCGNGSAELSFNVVQPETPRGDLSRSQKLVTRNGDTLTYTLIIRNASAVTSTVLVTDLLPANVSFVEGSLTSTAPIAGFNPPTCLQVNTALVSGCLQAAKQNFVQPTNGEVVWSGEVVSGTPVLIWFTVIANSGMPADTIVTNEALVDDGSGWIETIVANTQINPSLSLEINHGATMTRIPTVTLTYSSTRVMADVRFSNDSLFAVGVSAWMSATTPGELADWVVSTDGDLRLLRTVYIQFRDADGVVYGPAYATILFDPDAPTTPQISVFALQPAALLQNRLGQMPMQAHLPLTVTLQIGSGDTNSGVDTLVLSDDMYFTDPVTYTLHGASALIEWHVPSTYFHVPHVYAKSYDRAGNVSAMFDRQLVFQSFLIMVLKP